MSKNSLRNWFYRQFHPDSKSVTMLNQLVILLIISGFVLMMLETESTFSPSVLRIIDISQTAIVWTFAIEFGVRLWAVAEDTRFKGLSGRWLYFRQNKWLLLTDLIAFTPELLLIIFAAGQSEFIPLARAFRFFRLLKLFRYFAGFELVFMAVKDARQQLLASFGLALVTIFISAYFLYFAERNIQPETFGSALRALWWSVATLTTVGYGDVYPITPLGKILAAIISLIGVAMVALPAGILATSFQAQLQKKKILSENNVNE